VVRGRTQHRSPGFASKRSICLRLFAPFQATPTWLGSLFAEQGYDLSLNRTKELVHEEVEHRPPLENLAELRAIEQKILQGIQELEGMLR
jgi:hypothetical protein